MSAEHPAATPSRRVFLDRQWIGVILGSVYVSLRGPINRPLFSERNRIGLHVLPLGRGWRIVVRKAGGPLGA